MKSIKRLPGYILNWMIVSVAITTLMIIASAVVIAWATKRNNTDGLRLENKTRSLTAESVKRLGEIQGRSRFEQRGNQFKYRAKVKDEHGAQVSRWAWDVFLVTTE